MINLHTNNCACGQELSMIEQTAGKQQVPVWCSGMLDLNRWRYGKHTAHDIYNRAGQRLGKGNCQRMLHA